MELEYLGRRRRRSPPEQVSIPALRAVSAALFAITGLETAAGSRRGDALPPHGLRVVPSILAPVAVSAHVVHALRPDHGSAGLARIADGLAIAAGAVGTVASVLSAFDDQEQQLLLGRLPRRRSGRLPSLAPVTFALAGVLGLIVARQERRHAEDLERIASAERRARIVERIVPRRRGHRDRFTIRM